ncbi:hypothetical protein DY467_10805 [Rhodopseudomonas sp. BR0G17]|nr:hypothetical protein [Rhodopseudomonas sp. BR0G17]
MIGMHHLRSAPQPDSLSRLRERAGVRTLATGSVLAAAVHPPLEGEGRSRSERGGVAKSSSAVPAAHPTPACTALRALPADPPPLGEGEEGSGAMAFETLDAIALSVCVRDVRGVAVRGLCQ